MLLPPLPELQLDRRAVDLQVLVDLLQKLAQVGQLRDLAAVALGEGEVVLEHALHLAHVRLQRSRLVRVAEQRQLQLEARQHRAQVVTDAGQHGRALLHVRSDAVAHLEEGGGRLAHLARTARAEIVRHGASLAEGVGGFGESQDRADLIAQEQDRDGEQDDG